MSRIGIAIVEHQGCVLVGVRAAQTVLAGMHEFPGGKCLPDESHSTCAVRECLEETGLLVEPVEELDHRTFNYAHGEVELGFWRCRLADAAESTPVPPFAWIPRSDLAGLNFPEANKEVVQLLLRESQTH